MKPDTRERYGTLSRLLHWTMAVLVIWQALKLFDRINGGEHWVGQTLVPWHISIGTLIGVLIVVRIIWAIRNLDNRPAPAPPPTPEPASSRKPPAPRAARVSPSPSHWKAPVRRYSIPSARSFEFPSPASPSPAPPTPTRLMATLVKPACHWPMWPSPASAASWRKR